MGAEPRFAALRCRLSTCAAFEAFNEDGARAELFVDPTNGEIRQGKASATAKTTSADGISVTSLAKWCLIQQPPDRASEYPFA